MKKDETHEIRAHISWVGKNYSCTFATPELGAVIVTNKTLKGVKKDFEEALQFHIESCTEDGDILPEWIVNGNYKIEYVLNTAALLKVAETYTTLTAISRATGINVKQLSHYATGLKRPRKEQRTRIINGLHEIGRQMMSLT